VQRAPLTTVGLVAWEFFYYWYSWGMAGRTPGAALLGIRVVRRDGHHFDFRRAFVRTHAAARDATPA
jgi:uncharacterized RDD family membrane protein YckC